MAQRTITAEGKGCFYRLITGKCLNSKNSQPNLTYYEHGRCRYSYCPLIYKESHFDKSV